MAFTKVTLTGVIDTVKASFTKVNDLIDDLLSTGNGLGASQVGIEDTAGNMDAANVEDALAEIYTDTVNSRGFGDSLGENSSTTSGLTWGYNAGLVRSDKKVVSVSASTIGLSNNTTNYIQVDYLGVVSKNTTGFTQNKIPLRQITTLSGVQTISTDKRSFLFNLAFRVMGITLTSGTNPNTIKASGSGLFGCSSITQENNIGKGGAGTYFSLSADGSTLYILATALSVTAPDGLMCSVMLCETGTFPVVYSQGVASPPRLGVVFKDTSGNSLDLTSELAGAKIIYLTVLYVEL